MFDMHRAKMGEYRKKYNNRRRAEAKQAKAC